MSMLMIVLQMVNQLSIKIGETPERLPQSGNPGDVDQPAQLPVPSLNVEVTIPLKYLSNF